MKYKVGDRVVDDYLGSGTVTERIDCFRSPSCLVMFDHTPPVQHNMGDNPTFCFDYGLKKERIKKLRNKEVV